MNGSDFLASAQIFNDVYEKFVADFEKKLSDVWEAATEIGLSWSGSNIGYHSRVYHKDFVQPPPGSHFSAEWGLHGGAYSAGTTGLWQEYARATVEEQIWKTAKHQDFGDAQKMATEMESHFKSFHPDILSKMTIVIEEHPDVFLQHLCKRVENLSVRGKEEILQLLVPKGDYWSRDSLAMTQGRQLAPHQQILSEILFLRQPAISIKDLCDMSSQFGSHLIRLQTNKRRKNLVGTNVFIGHGRSSAWMILKDFLKDRLSLPYDEFNRVPVAGITNIARLSEMLESAAVAFIILTAEDEQADGKIHARMNVIHEVGLFQGKLGFTKAIVLFEEGCEEFSNIQGLGQIRFPNGKISAAFEEIRRVLERENLIIQ